MESCCWWANNYLKYSKIKIIDEYIATASSNGCVVLWNLERAQKNKPDSKFQLHERSVNKVAFHPTDPNLLISASVDASVKLIDFRNAAVPTITFQRCEQCQGIISIISHILQHK
jgi:WD40 repeat protein